MNAFKISRPRMYSAVIIFIPESHVHVHVRMRVTNTHLHLGRKSGQAMARMYGPVDGHNGEGAGEGYPSRPSWLGSAVSSRFGVWSCAPAFCI